MWRRKAKGQKQLKISSWGKQEHQIFMQESYRNSMQRKGRKTALDQLVIFETSNPLDPIGYVLRCNVNRSPVNLGKGSEAESTEIHWKSEQKQLHVSDNWCTNSETRWYPWGVQRLVSTYSNRQNPKCQDLSTFQFLGVGGWGAGDRGVLSNLVKNFWKPSLPVHHR